MIPMPGGGDAVSFRRKETLIPCAVGPNTYVNVGAIPMYSKVQWPIVGPNRRHAFLFDVLPHFSQWLWRYKKKKYKPKKSAEGSNLLQLTM
jgi:hypothetical protein